MRVDVDEVWVGWVILPKGTGGIWDWETWWSAGAGEEGGVALVEGAQDSVNDEGQFEEGADTVDDVHCSLGCCCRSLVLIV